MLSRLAPEGLIDDRAAATLLFPLIAMSQTGRRTLLYSDKGTPGAPPAPAPTPTGGRRPPGIIAALALLGLGALVLVVFMANRDGDERAEPSPAESAASESVQSSPPAGETSSTESSSSGAGEPGAGEPESKKSQSGKSQSGKSESEKSESGNTASRRSESGKTEGGESESERTESGKSESAKSNSAKSEPAENREPNRQRESRTDSEPAAQKTSSEQSPADKSPADSNPASKEEPPPAMPDPPTEPEHLFRPHRYAIAKQCKKPHGLDSALIVLRITIDDAWSMRAEAISAEEGARQTAANCIKEYIRTKVKVPKTYTGAKNFSYAF
jgi:hypothetical protein